jgi:hypothetical protein
MGSVTGLVFDGALDFEIFFSTLRNSCSLFIFPPLHDHLRRLAIHTMLYALDIYPDPIGATSSTHLSRKY